MHYPTQKKGAAIIMVIMFFVIIATTFVVGLSSPVVREYVTARNFEKSKGAYYLSEASHEDALYRIKYGKQIGAEEVLTLNGNTATTTITNVSGAEKIISSIGDIIKNTRRVKSILTTSSGESFSYGVQAGEGGVLLQNSSTITGSLFSAGPVVGSNNLISGTIIAGGTTGLNGTVSGIQNQGGSSMYAGSITNSTISGYAYCNTISSSSTSTCKTLTAQIAQPFPITATDIANFEAAALVGEEVICTGGKYDISSNTTIGPKKIPCDFVITGTGSGGGPVITLGGPLWVTGNITVKNHVTIRVDPSLVGQSIMLIADNLSNHTTSSKVKIEGEGLYFTGAPGGNSWIMLISENTGASQGNDNEAIELEQGVQGDILLYARLGDIKLKNNASVKEVTGYKITLQNSANVIYSSGLQNALFTSGPGGSWTIQDWKEGQ